MTESALVVTGSLNMDFVVQVDRLPSPGETVLGSGFQMIPGGKGANQACAAGKLAAHVAVRMIGRAGADPFAGHLRSSLAQAGVEVSAVRDSPNLPTGVALIWVERSGQNSIVVASGANLELSSDDIDSARLAFTGARYALFQLESPLPTVEHALAVAHAAGARTILDPAPARLLPPSLLSQVDILTPNESEACILLGRNPTGVTFQDARQIAAALHALGPREVVLKLGSQGCYYSGPGLTLGVEGFPVEAIDTTAAGDTFNAALAVALSEDLPLHEALRFANAAAAISVTRLGAQASAPSRAEVDAFLALRA
ncbi:MAG: ribokinase [Candidatus Solibacter usitatus]|nr:ribokinase [Candidatus Solibacter usitatus]